MSDEQVDPTQDADTDTSVDDDDDQDAVDPAGPLTPNVRNDDLRPFQADPNAVAPTSDPAPDDLDAAFGGVPLDDADVDSLPLEETDDP